MTAVRKSVSEKKRDEKSKFPYKLSMRLSVSANEAFNKWFASNRCIESSAHAFRALLDVLPTSSTPLTLGQISAVAEAANTVRSDASNPTSRWNPSGGTTILRLRPAVTEEQHNKLTAVFNQLADHCSATSQAALSDGAIAYGLLKVFGNAAIASLTAATAMPANAAETVSAPSKKSTSRPRASTMK